VGITSHGKNQTEQPMDGFAGFKNIFLVLSKNKNTFAKNIRLFSS
jgi:hypothetical protein